MSKRVAIFAGIDAAKRKHLDPKAGDTYYRLELELDHPCVPRGRIYLQAPIAFYPTKNTKDGVVEDDTTMLLCLTYVASCINMLPEYLQLQGYVAYVNDTEAWLDKPLSFNGFCSNPELQDKYPGGEGRNKTDKEN